MPITERENDSESIWLKAFANKTSHFVASWYRPPGSTSEEFQLFREQLDYIRTHHKGKKLPSVHILGKGIDWPARLSKSGSTLSQSEGQLFCPLFKKSDRSLACNFLDLCTLQVTRTHSMFKYHGSS